MKIKVTQKHIDIGEPFDGSACPIAQAVRDLGYIDVVIGDDGGMKVNGQRYFIGLAAAKFVQAFDDGRKVDPFEFTAIYVDEDQ